MGRTVYLPNMNGWFFYVFSCREILIYMIVPWNPSWERLFEGRKTDCLMARKGHKLDPSLPLLVFCHGQVLTCPSVVFSNSSPKRIASLPNLRWLQVTTLQFICGFPTTVRSKKLNEINGKVIHLLEIIASVSRFAEATKNHHRNEPVTGLEA